SQRIQREQPLLHDIRSAAGIPNGTGVRLKPRFCDPPIHFLIMSRRNKATEGTEATEAKNSNPGRAPIAKHKRSPSLSVSSASSVANFSSSHFLRPFANRAGLKKEGPRRDSGEVLP